MGRSIFKISTVFTLALFFIIPRLSAQDAGVTALLSPLANSCGSASGQIKVIVYNYGSSAISDIPVKVEITGDLTFSASDTLKTTLAKGAQDTLTFKSTINTYSGGKYEFKTYTLLSGDNDAGNDTLHSHIIVFGIPNTPTRSAGTRCGAGPVTFKASSTTSGSSTYWYASSTSAVPFSTGDSITVNLSSTTTYYAASALGRSFDSLTSTFAGGSGLIGSMFDVNAYKTVNIDSFDLSSYSGLKDTVYLYYKTGTYSGYQTKSSAWTLAGKYFVNVSSGTHPIHADFGSSITLKAGQTYGFYITLSGLSSTKKALLSVTNSSDSSYNSDMTITSGDGFKSLFGSYGSSYRWNGRIYYSTVSCSSPRTALTGTIKPEVKAQERTQTKTTAGAFNDGTAANPDEICVGDSFKYDFTTPSNFLNSEYGAKWKLKVTMITASGFHTSNYKETNPSASGPGALVVTPLAIDADSVYIITVTATNLSSGCDSVFMRYIHINQAPVSKFSIGNSCFGHAVSPANTSTPSTGVNYLWDFGNGDTSSAKVPSYKYGAPGTYTVALTVSNASCKASVSNSVTIYDAPYGSNFLKSSPFRGQFNSGDFIDPDNICLGDTNTYQITPPKGLSNSDYGTKWTIASLSFQTAFGTKIKDTAMVLPKTSKNATFSFFPKSFSDSVFILKVVLRTMPGNCDSVLTRQIHIRVKPVAGFSFSNACLGFPLSFNDTSHVAISSVSKWSWDFGDGNTSNAQNPNHAYKADGTYQVTLTSATDEGCSNTISQTVVQYPRPVAKFGRALACNGFSSSFLDSSTLKSGSLTSWSWDFGDQSTSNAQNATHSYTQSGPYNVKLVVISALGCRDSTTQKITILPSPQPVFTYKNACVGSIVYTANTSVDSSGQSSYLWDFGDGFTTTATNPTHIYKANNTYRIKLKVTAKTGCSDTMSQTITPYPKPTVNFYSPGGCAGQAVTFSDSGKSGNSALYKWNYGDGGTDIVKNPVTTHTYTKAGTYSVLLVLTNSDGCIDSERKNITTIDFPQAGFRASAVCLGKATVFTNTSTGTDSLSYRWNFGDNSHEATDTDPLHTFNNAGTFQVKLTVENKMGCTDSAMAGVTVNALPPKPVFTKNQNGYKVVFMPSDTGLSGYKWYFGTPGNDSSTLKSPAFVYPTADAKYQVKLLVTNAAGCSAESEDSVFTGKYGITPAGKIIQDISVYPNPFASGTSVSYNLLSRSQVRITVYNMQGKEIAIVKNGLFAPGSYTDFVDAGKINWINGIYLLKLEVNDACFVTRIAKIK